MSENDFDLDLIDVSMVDDFFFLWPEMIPHRDVIMQGWRENNERCHEEELDIIEMRNRRRTPKTFNRRPLMTNTVSRTATITKKRTEMFCRPNRYEQGLSTELLFHDEPQESTPYGRRMSQDSLLDDSLMSTTMNLTSDTYTLSPGSKTYTKSPLNSSMARLSTRTYTLNSPGNSTADLSVLSLPQNSSLCRLSTKTYTVSPPRLASTDDGLSLTSSPPLSRCASLSGCSESSLAPGLRMNMNGFGMNNRLGSAIGSNGSQTISRGKIMAPSSKYVPSSAIFSQASQMLPPAQPPPQRSGMAQPTAGMPRKTPRASNLIRPKATLGGGSRIPLAPANGH